jgi:EmrB/QacA subfamily drug resistance transporter
MEPVVGRDSFQVEPFSVGFESSGLESGEEKVAAQTPAAPPKTQRGVKFWGIIAALCLLSFISALDVAIITTALPTITSQIGGETQYVWIANSFVLASSVLQPLFGQLADIIGRRIPLIVSTILFAVGSGIAGGANNVAMLIAGRTIQGVGAGGLYVLLDIICCDLVPLRERGKYLGIMFSWAGLAAAIGPALGGALAEKNWRWIFYLNIPICGVALGIILVFMQVKSGMKGTYKWKQLDYLGNLIFIPSITSLLFGLFMGGVTYPWASWRVIMPIVLGIVGWATFHVQQHFTSTPSVPNRLFANRTSAAAYFLTFLSSATVQMVGYFMPIYFQAVQATSVLDSGTYYLPFAFGTLAFAVISGVLLSKFGAYRPLHVASFALSAIGFGLFTLLTDHSPKVMWAWFELIASMGSGAILSVLLPAVMAALPESDVAAASAAFCFIRTFGYIWGVTIASIVFNDQVNRNLGTISDLGMREALKDGAAYAYASQAHVLKDRLLGENPQLWAEIVRVYITSLNTIWWVGLGISILGFFCVGFERGLELRQELDTDYGIEEPKS